jgi:hypothetical protein
VQWLGSAAGVVERAARRCVVVRAQGQDAPLAPSSASDWPRVLLQVEKTPNSPVCVVCGRSE